MITAYASGSCSLCKRIVRELHASVTAGPLKGKAFLCVKPFTMGIADCALLAAQNQNRFWDYFLALSQVKERLSQVQLLRIADSLGLKKKVFWHDMNDASVKELLTRSANEARKNGVTVTPTFFINNCRYRSYKDSQWVIDAAEYRFEILRKNKTVPP